MTSVLALLSAVAPGAAAAGVLVLRMLRGFAFDITVRGGSRFNRVTARLTGVFRPVAVVQWPR